MHLKFGNVNSRLFKVVLIPGVIGAASGAYLLTQLANLDIVAHYMVPGISVYTAILGILILKKALVKKPKKRPVKQIGLLAWFGGFVDAIGGGGWGPIVNSTLIAAGRHPRYTIGSVNLAEFFVSFASSVFSRSMPVWVTTAWLFLPDSGRYDCRPYCGPAGAKTPR